MGLVKKITAGLTAREVMQHQLLRHGAIYTISGIINKAIPFFLLPIITAYILPAEYGLLSNYTGWVDLMTPFLAFYGLTAFTVNFYKFSSHKEKAEYLTNTLFLWFLSILFLLILAFSLGGVVQKYYQIEENWLFTGVLQIGLAFISSGVLLTIFRLEEKPLQFSIATFCQMLLEFSFAIYFIVFLLKGWEGRVYSMLIVHAVFCVIGFWYLWRRKYIILRFRKDYIKEQLVVGLPLLLMGILASGKSFVDKGFITDMLSIYENGIYSVALRFGVLMLVVIGAVGATLNPFIYKFLSNSSVAHSIKKKLVRLMYLYFLGLIGLSFLLYWFSKMVIVDYFRPEWKESVPYILWILLGWAFYGMSLVISQFIIFIKKTKFILYTNGFSYLLHICLVYFLIEKWEVIGVAYLFCGINFLTFVVIWVISWTIYPMPWLDFRFLK